LADQVTKIGTNKMRSAGP